MQSVTRFSHFWRFAIIASICWMVLILCQGPSFDNLSSSLAALKVQIAHVPIQGIKPGRFDEVIFQPEDDVSGGAAVNEQLSVSVKGQHDPNQNSLTSQFEVPESFTNPHGIEISRLWESAKKNQKLILDRQSKSLNQAKSEYQRRYQLPPPPGFDEWYAYAVKHESPLIDEFDDLMESVRPFRKYQESGCQFDHKMDELPAMLPVCINNQTIDVGNPGAYDNKQIAIPFKEFTSDFLSALPDMCFYINTFDEPRQIIPLEKRNSTRSERDLVCEKHNFTGFKRENIWTQVITPCEQSTPAVTASTGNQNITNYGRLVESWDEATNLCSFGQTPPTGILRCPENFSVTSAARPVLSAARLSTFGDILFPTLWRWRFDSKIGEKWAQTEDKTPWEEKINRVGWRGSSTGGYALGDNWRQFQRHRMVSLARGMSQPAPYFVNSTQRLQEWLDVNFTAIVACETEACEAINRELPPVVNQILSDTFKNKIVLDMDGHGLSGRFYMLLQSGSAVMKQGLVREWHDSRLLPWLHYIPLSMGMAELDDMLQYLFTEGDHILSSIAAESQAWTANALRREDMRVYMYRLLIELGRRSF
ncbi:glycosyltransferase family 90 protein [Phlyctema vagabunda]|uniref:Glycosyltransferase family 90 protein n=1 Tax=Phlyctema vagabunda TaxID=108571 RepID=A0ABR4PQX3_9HELO